MACPDNALLLHAYLDGELDLIHSLELEEHLKACAACTQELLSQQTLRKAMQASNLRQRAPRGLEERIRAGISAEAPAGQSAETKAGAQRVEIISAKRYPGKRVFEWLAVAAAVLIVAAIGVRMAPGIVGDREADLLTQEIVASHIRSLQPGHLFDVESTDQHTVKPWFDGKLDFSPPVRDEADQGFPLVGGRLDYIGRQDAAALVYQRHKHVINVFVWPEDSKMGKLPGLQSREGYNVVFWRQEGMEFCAVSDVNASELQQFTQLLQR